jgi:hypothetical protein
MQARVRNHFALRNMALLGSLGAGFDSHSSIGYITLKTMVIVRKWRQHHGLQQVEEGNVLTTVFKEK